MKAKFNLRSLPALILLCATLFSVAESQAQLDTSFWFVAPRVTSHHDQSPTEFVIASGNFANTEIRITKPADPGWGGQTINLGTFGVQRVSIATNLFYPQAPADTVPGQITNYGFHISSDNPITVYYEASGGNNNPDIFALKGKNGLGNSFVVPFQDYYENVDPFVDHPNGAVDVLAGWANDAPKSAIDIVASEDSTEVTFIMGDDAVGHPAGSTFTITLDQGQTYRLKATSRLASGKLNGTQITSTKPIAVTISDDSVYEINDGNNDFCADLIGDQLIPTSIIGQEYTVMKGWLSGWGGDQDKIFFQAIEDNTQILVTTNGGTTNLFASVANMASFPLTEPVAHISADKPIYVLHVSGNGCEMGGAIIPPIDQCTGSSNAAFVRTDPDRFGLNIIVKSGSENSFTLDGGPYVINGGSFLDVPGTAGVWKYLNVDFGTDNVQIPTGNNIRISNSSSFFHLGVINGESVAGGTRYGYFSSYANLDLGDDATLCPGEAVVLDPKAGADSYVWSDGSTESTIEVDTAGEYRITATFGGCEAVDFVTMSLFADPDVDLGDGFALCNANSIDAGAGYVGYDWSSGQSTQAITVSTSGDYSVTVTSNDGCTDRDTVTVTIDTNPSVTLNNASICEGESHVLDAGAGYTYEWSDGSTEQTLTVSTAGNYSVTVQNGGCTASDDMTLTVHANPEINLADASICSDQPLTLDAGAGYTYDWSTGESSRTISVLNEGAYHVTITDGNSCTDRDTMTLSHYTDPSVTLTDDEICQGQSLTLDAGAGFSNYNWSNGGGGQTISVGLSGNYHVTITDANGCTDRDTMALTVKPNPSVALNNAAICEGESHTLTANAGYTYVWSEGSTTQSINITDANTYALTATLNGCSASDDMTLTVHANPTVVLSDATICESNTETLDAGAGFAIYNWSTGEDTQTIDITDAGNYSVTITDANDCQDVDSMNLGTLDAPVVSNFATTCNDFNTGYTITFDISDGDVGSYDVSGISGSLVGANFTSDELATGDAYTITVDDANGCDPQVLSGSYACGCTSASGSMNNAGLLSNCGPGVITADYNDDYTFDGNDTIMFVLHTSSAAVLGTIIDSLQTPEVTFDAATMNYGTTYYLSPVVGDHTTDGWVDLIGDGCKSVGVGQPIVFYRLPQVNLSDEAVCDGDSIQLNAGTFASYNWSNGNSVQSFYVESAGEYSVTVTNANNCTDRDSMTFTVNDNPVVVLADQSICDGDDIDLDAGAGFSYVWSTGGTNQTISVNSPGNYSVVIIDGNNCIGQDDMDLVVNSNPALNLQDQTICDDESVVLNAGAGLSSYAWSDGSSSATLEISDAGSYGVTIEDANGCQSADAMTLTVNDLPVPSLTDESICTGGQTILDPGAGFAAYLWSSGSIQPTRTVSAAGAYSVTVTDDNGCQGEATMSLTLLDVPDVELSDQQACAGQTLNFDAGPGSAYLWHDGSSQQMFSAVESGVVSVTVTNDDGCLASGSATSTIHANPTPAIADLEECTATGSTLSTTEIYTAYAWSSGESTSTIVPAANDIYSVTVTDDNGCSGSTETEVSLFRVPGLTVFIDDPAICLGDTANLVVDIDDAGNEGPYCMEYTINGSAQTAICEMNSGRNMVTLAVDQNTTLAITRVTALSGCTYEDDRYDGFNLTVHGIPGMVVDTIGALCDNTTGAGVEFTLQRGALPWDLQYKYEGDLQVVRNLKDSIHVVPAEAGLYEFILLTDDNGCRSAAEGAEVTIEVLPPNMPELTYDANPRPSCEGMEYTLTSTGSNLESWYWVVNGEVHDDLEPVVAVPYGQAADFALFGRTSTCSDDTTANVAIGAFEDYLSISNQNVFSPDGDGLNDVFDLDPENFYTDCAVLRVFNRWGTLIYEGTVGDSSWDGSGFTSDAPQGTYFVVYDIDGYGQYNHSVTLFR